MKIAKMLVFLLLLSPWAHAQLSKEQFEIKNKAEGASIAEFIVRQKVSLGEQQKGWYPIKVKFLVEKNFVSADSMMMVDAALMNSEKEKIGQSTGEAKLQLQEAEGRGMHKYYWAILSGFVKSYDIEYSTIPEVALAKIFNQKSIVKQQEEAKAYFEKMGFEEEEYGDFTVFVYSDAPAFLGEAAFRTIVVFRGGSRVYAIISQMGGMQLDGIKDERTHSTGHYYFYQRAQDKLFVELQDIAYSYIPL